MYLKAVEIDLMVPEASVAMGVRGHGLDVGFENLEQVWALCVAINDFDFRLIRNENRLEESRAVVSLWK